MTPTVARSTTEQTQRNERCIHTIRTLAMDAVQKAKSGHPGMPMGAAPMAFVLWTKFLKHNPRNPKWPDRDRFILSAGHGCMLLYALLHLTGYDLSLDEIKNFRQFGSLTPGHPESLETPGVEATTGPLGQGFANGVGMAIAAKHLAAVYNRPGHEVVDHFIYAIVSDGDLMEGISHEAASLAGHLKLGNLIYLYDDNHISIDGPTELTFTEDVLKRFEAYHWHTQRVEDGNDLDAIETALRNAQAANDRPSLIAVRTHIAYGAPNKQDTAAAHGAPLGEDEIKLWKEKFGWPVDRPFYIPDDVLAYFRQAVARGAQREAEWNAKWKNYESAHPDLARQFKRALAGELPADWADDLPKFSADEKPLATREASGKVLNAMAPRLPMLIGGSADLTPSTETYLKNYPTLSADYYAGRNLHFGVREHAMGATLNGMALHGGVIPYGATFLIFTDYARPAIRLAALQRVQVIFVMTHDSVGLGEDGPTHQPIEQLASLRAIHNLVVIRPADANETAAAWKIAIERKTGPTLLALSRQKLPILDRTRYASAEHLAKGAYVLAESPKSSIEVILIATGSEVALALAAREKLSEQNVGARVVSMPSWELFEEQPESYRRQVLPPEIQARLAIEAASPMGWERWVGSHGDVIGMKRFGASAPGSVLMENFGFTVDNVVARVLKRLGR